MRNILAVGAIADWQQPASQKVVDLPGNEKVNRVAKGVFTERKMRRTKKVYIAPIPRNR